MTLYSTVPVQYADLFGCFCQSDEYYGFLKEGPLGFPWQLDMLLTSAQPICDIQTERISLGEQKRTKSSNEEKTWSSHIQT